MPSIRVEMFKGQTVGKKREIVRALTEAYVACTGVDSRVVDVRLIDVEKSDWGQGGKLYSDTIPD